MDFAAGLRNSLSLKNFFKSNIYLMKLAHRLLEKFDLFLPLERDYEIVGFLPHLDSQIILDIGAHKGESVRSFRKFSSSPIFSIEANPVHERDLRKLKQKIKDFDYMMVLAADYNGIGTLYLPSYQGQELTVWSSCSEDSARKIFADRTSLKNLDSCLQFKSLEIKAMSLDELELDPFLIKIDVEGQEAKVLRGLVKTIAKSYPVLMIENNDPNAVAELLEPMGYRAYIYNNGEFLPYIRQGNLNLIWIAAKNYDAQAPEQMCSRH